MKVQIVIFLSLVLAACGGMVERKAPGMENEAVRDFVATSELTEVNKIRMRQQVQYRYVNDYYVVVPQRDGYHLVELHGRCPELRERYWTTLMMDHRTNARSLHTGDTIRGCMVDKIFELTDSQVEELRVLGDAPGNEQASPQPK